MKKKILIVDDEPDIVSYLEMVLQDQGYETITAGNGNEALEAVKRDRPDLVTLDITMPEASGTRFYKEIRLDPELSSIPVIIVTAVTGLGRRQVRLREVHQPPPSGAGSGGVLPETHRPGGLHRGGQEVTGGVGAGSRRRPWDTARPVLIPPRVDSEGGWGPSAPT